MAEVGREGGGGGQPLLGGEGVPGAGPIYVSFREVRGPPLKAPYGKKPICVKRYYLIDIHGNEVLAAFGEDQGYPPPPFFDSACLLTLSVHSARWWSRLQRKSQEHSKIISPYEWGWGLA